MLTAEQLRPFLLERLSLRMRMLGVQPGALHDDFDLYGAGLLDSLGVIQLLGAIEDRFRVTITLEEVDPQQIFTIGGLLQYAGAAQTAPENAG